MDQQQQQPQQSHPGDAMVSGILQALMHPSVIGVLHTQNFKALGEVLVSVADNQSGLHASMFQAQPRLKEDGSALILLDSIRQVEGMFRLLAVQIPPKEEVAAADVGRLSDYEIYIWSENRNSLHDSKHVELLAEDKVEIVRQLRAINWTGNRVYGLMQIPQLIQGYTYFESEADKAKRLVAEAEAAKKLAEEKLEQARLAALASPESAKTQVAQVTESVTNANTDQPAEAGTSPQAPLSSTDVLAAALNNQA